MRKGKDLIGKTMVAFDTGERLAPVRNLILDEENNRLLGFLVDGRGGSRAPGRKSRPVLPLPSVQAIGPDAIIAPARSALVEREAVPEIQRVLERDDPLVGK